MLQRNKNKLKRKPAETNKENHKLSNCLQFNIEVFACQATFQIFHKGINTYSTNDTSPAMEPTTPGVALNQEGCIPNRRPLPHGALEHLAAEQPC